MATDNKISTYVYLELFKIRGAEAILNNAQPAVHWFEFHCMSFFCICVHHACAYNWSDLCGSCGYNL